MTDISPYEFTPAFELLDFTPIDSERLRRASRAAIYCGQTSARIVNASLAGQAEKVELWQHELVVWQKRQREVTRRMVHRYTVVDELDILENQVYLANVVTEGTNH